MNQHFFLIVIRHLYSESSFETNNISVSIVLKLIHPLFELARSGLSDFD